MKILEIKALPNGAHRNQEWDKLPIPDGWAVIPEDMELENFPFGNVTAEEVIHYKDVTVLRDVIKTREVPAVDEDGNPVMAEEEYTEQEMVTEQQPYGVMTVTGWEPLPMPEPEPEPALTPSVWDEMDAAYREGVNGV